jgi:hypothetical protein
MFVKDLGHNTVSYRPVIFPDECVHLHVATVIACTPEFEGYAVRSAGFITLGLTFKGRTFPLTCHGGSETMKLEHHADDAAIITWYEYGGKVGAPLPPGL